MLASIDVETVKKPRVGRREAVESWMASGSIEARLRAYLARCHKEEDAFPNLAGFCRYLGIGIRTFIALGERYPAAYDAVMTQLEDEALNAQRLPANSASLTAAYFKRRLGYDGEEESGRSGEVRVIFDHDIALAGV
jgi:hypothetical protein